MTRVIIENLLAFFLPALLYLAFALVSRKPNTSVGTVVNQAPLLLLALTGALCVAAVLALFGKVGDGKPGQAYEPATYKDGKVVPGRMR
jgi:Family of unknown function (DUF6111)